VIFICLFFAGRAGLILHEFLGHGFACLLLGGSITNIHLSFFGGGWILYAPWPEDLSIAQQLFLDLSGVAVECGVGIVLMLWARNVRKFLFLKLLLVACASVFWVHGLFYLVTGTLDGYGDGRLLYQLLSQPWRTVICALFTLIFLGSGWLTSHLYSPLFRNITGQQEGWPQWRIMLMAGLLAAGLHGALTLMEARLSNDPTAAHFSQTIVESQIEAKLLEQIEVYRVDNGTSPSQEKIQLFRDNLQAQMGKLSSQTILLPALVLAIFLGTLSSLNKKTRYSNTGPI
jgi:hypothetical protein